MIRIFGVSKELKVFELNSIKDLSREDIFWYWADFSAPDENETKLLKDYFNFHQLSIEDCIYGLNRPKLDYYDEYVFLILNALNQDNLELEEVALFVSPNYIVSYHVENMSEIDEAWDRVVNTDKDLSIGPSYATHQIMDMIIHGFFPAVNKIEDYLTDIDTSSQKQPISKLIEDVFRIRGDLLKLRRLVNSMRDLLYRIINSERLEHFERHKMYFADLHDHLLKLSEMIESSRDMTSDMRDSYISINTNRMNTHMMLLTVITSIFIPLTFIAGIYGMNFEYMPELGWKYGYFASLVIMAVIGVIMFLWFKRKGWFDI